MCNVLKTILNILGIILKMFSKNHVKSASISNKVNKVRWDQPSQDTIVIRIIQSKPLLTTEAT
jgi:hypothetical protein